MFVNLTPALLLHFTLHYDIVETTFVRKFFVHKASNHNYGKSFEFQVYEIIIRSVQLVGYSQRFSSEFLIYLSFPNILDHVCFVVFYLSVFLGCRIFDDIVGKIVIRKAS